MSTTDFDVGVMFGYATLTVPRASEISPDRFALMLPEMMDALGDAHATAFGADAEATSYRYLFGAWLDAPNPLDVRVSLSLVTPDQLARDRARIAERLVRNHLEGIQGP